LQKTNLFCVVIFKVRYGVVVLSISADPLVLQSYLFTTPVVVAENDIVIGVYSNVNWLATIDIVGSGLL